MKKAILRATLTALLLPCSCAHKPSEGEVNLLSIEQKDDRTHTYATFTGYLDKKGRLIKHGRFIDHYPNGSLLLEANYSHGKLDGECKTFTDTGNIFTLGIYREDKPFDGVFECGDYVMRYAQGKFIGYVTNFTEGGAMKSPSAKQK